MNVYFIRHGEAGGNLNRTHQGADDPLTKKGKFQVKALSKKLKNVPIDFIYSSPYFRARQTADLISKELKLTVEYWDDLKERRRPSEVEGLSYDHPEAIKISQTTKENQTTANWRYSDDESYNDLLKRAKIVETHLLKKHMYQNVLCVSHIGILMIIVLQMILKDKLTPKVFWQYYHHSKHDNTGITHLKYSNVNGWRFVAWNDTSHL